MNLAGEPHPGALRAGEPATRDRAALASPWRRGAAAALVALALHAAGVLEFLELRLIELRFPLASRQPSDSVVLVEIDRRSLDEIGVWPWPRKLHALAVDRLNAAGAAGISFDVDFSARSDEASDAALARAVARSRAPVRLAAFSDPGGGVDVGPIGPLLAAAEPVNVNASMEVDGRLWRFAPRAPWRGGEIRALFVGLADRPAGDAPFWIDYGIEAESLPVLSFVDVAAGRFDAESVRGRQVIVGATAIELGDLVATPRYGVLPGPVAQVLAAQSLELGRALRRSGPAETALLTFVAAVAASVSLRRRRFDATVAGPVVVAAGSFALGAAALRVHPILLDVAPAIVASALAVPLALASRAALLDMRLLAESLALARANRFLGKVADNIADAVVTLDGTGAVRTRNRAANRIFGLSEDAPPERPETLALRPRFRDGAALIDALARVARPERRRRIICRRGDGARFYAEIAASALDDQGERIWILLLRDVTAEVALEREARRRERLLRVLKMRAEAASRAKSEFVATMSHELRTPLNAIIGFSSMMSDEALGPLGTEAYRPMANEIRNSGARLLRVLTHVLDHANAEMDRLEIRPEPQDLAALASEAAELQRARAERAEVSVTVSASAAPLVFEVDPTAIRKALGNVISNAIRFSHAGGRIEIAVSEEPDGGAKIVVRDEGVGMSPELVARCMEPFEQADRSARRSFDGAGLGLTVARIFLRAHGGDVSISSVEGRGSAVAMRLPASRRSAPLATAGAPGALAAE